MAVAKDPVGAQFGLWEGRGFVGCEVVSRVAAPQRPGHPRPRACPGVLRGRVRLHPRRQPGPARTDFTFLRRPDGHEIGGISGVPGVSSSWTTLFEVADTDAAVARAAEAGGTPGTPEDFVYGCLAATVTDPFGAEFPVDRAPRLSGLMQPRATRNQVSSSPLALDLDRPSRSKW